MPCFGKPVLTAGTGRYAGRGFTLDSATREEYRARLARLQDLPPLTPEQTLLAKKHAYALFRVRPWKLETLQTLYTPVPIGGHPLEQNLALRLRSPRDLAEAPDLRAFARWAADARDLDYLQALPPLAQEPAAERTLAGAGSAPT
jgi:hypothetical protein